MLAIEIAKVVDEIVTHHEENPTHGINCACMDKYISQLRRLTAVKDRDAQCRVDYVMRTATNR